MQSENPPLPPVMILKFTTADMLNTDLVDAATGAPTYSIITAVDLTANDGEEDATLSPPHADDKHALVSENDNLSSYLPPPPPPARRTWVYDASGKVQLEIGWNGRRPEEFILAGKKIGGLSNLFGTSTVQFLSVSTSNSSATSLSLSIFRPKILSIPTRFDTECIWTATADSLTVCSHTQFGLGNN